MLERCELIRAPKQRWLYTTNIKIVTKTRRKKKNKKSNSRRHFAEYSRPPSKTATDSGETDGTAEIHPTRPDGVEAAVDGCVFMPTMMPIQSLSDANLMGKVDRPRSPLFLQEASADYKMAQPGA